MEQIVGNAVPVNLAEYVATHLKEYIDNPKNNPIQLQFNID